MRTRKWHSTAICGWTAYSVEMTFPGVGSCSFKFTTAVREVPDHLPFGPPADVEQAVTRSLPSTGGGACEPPCTLPNGNPLERSPKAGGG